jgi:hypothetical protein
MFWIMRDIFPRTSKVIFYKFNGGRLMEEEPKEAVTEFLNSLPDTIRSNWLLRARILLAFALGLPDIDVSDAVHLKQLCGLLESEFVPGRIGALVSICAVVDQIIFECQKNARNRTVEKFCDNHAEDFINKFGSSLLQETALKIPLIQKHEAAAAAKWRSLRETILSPEKIELASQIWTSSPP